MLEIINENGLPAPRSKQNTQNRIPSMNFINALTQKFRYDNES